MTRRAAAVALLALACRAEPLPPAERYPAGTGYQARELTADGTRIRYVDAGRGPAVVMIHGFGGSIYSWRHTIAPVVHAGFRVIAFDNRGFGFSGKPETGYTNADCVRLAVALLDSLGVGDAVLVGHSMGGQIAAEVALVHPHRVRGLALLGASGYGVREPALLYMARWPFVGPLVAAFRGRWTTGTVLKSAYADPRKVTAADVDQYYAPVAEPEYGLSLRGVLREYRFDALAGRLGAVRVPTLVLWGAHDRWIPPVVGRRLAAELERVAFFMIADAGHALAEEAPDSTNRLLVTFLTEGIPRIPENLAGRRLGGQAGSVPGWPHEGGVIFFNRTVEGAATCAGSSVTTERYESSPPRARSSRSGAWTADGSSAWSGGRASTSSSSSTISTPSVGSTRPCFNTRPQSWSRRSRTSQSRPAARWSAFAKR